MDILLDTVSHLSDSLDCRVATERPANPPGEMVTVTRVGGGGSMFLDSPRVSVHAWAETEAEAYKLGMAAADAMFSLPAHSPDVAEVTQNSFYSNIYPDGTRRWSGVYVVTCNR